MPCGPWVGELRPVIGRLVAADGVVCLVWSAWRGLLGVGGFSRVPVRWTRRLLALLFAELVGEVGVGGGSGVEPGGESTQVLGGEAQLADHVFGGEARVGVAAVEEVGEVLGDEGGAVQEVVELGEQFGEQDQGDCWQGDQWRLLAGGLGRGMGVLLGGGQGRFEGCVSLSGKSMRSRTVAYRQAVVMD